MKKRVKSYNFNAANGILRLNDLSHVELAKLLLVTNVVDDIIIYNFGDYSVGTATVVDTNAFNLSFDTSSMSDSDELLIYYEFDDDDPHLRDAPMDVVMHPGQVDFPVDLRIDGNDIRSDSPGVQAVSLIGPTGDAVDTVNGGVLVTPTNANDVVRPTPIPGYPTPMAPGQAMGVVAGGVWTIPYTIIPGQTLLFDAASFRGVSLSVFTGATVSFYSGPLPTYLPALTMQHTTTGVSMVNNAAGGTTTGIYIANLPSRYFAITSTITQSGVITFTALPIEKTSLQVNTPTIGATTNTTGVITSNQNMVNQVSSAGAIGAWSAQTDISDGRFAPTVTTAPNTYTHAGAGIAAVGLVGQFDDVAQPMPNENSMGRVRVSKKRSLLGEIRDGSIGQQEVGARVTTRQALQVEEVQSGQFGDVPILQVQPGVQGVALVGETGDPMGTTGSALNVVDVTRLVRTPFSDFGVNTSGVVDCNSLLAVVVTNINASLRYLQIFNSATQPIAGSVPQWSIPIPGGSASSPGSVSLGQEFLGDKGTSFATGIAWGISTTAAYFTAATASDHIVNGVSA